MPAVVILCTLIWIMRECVCHVCVLCVCVSSMMNQEQSNTIIVKYSFECDWPKTMAVVCAIERQSIRWRKQATNRVVYAIICRMENAKEKSTFVCSNSIHRWPMVIERGKLVSVLLFDSCDRSCVCEGKLQLFDLTLTICFDSQYIRIRDYYALRLTTRTTMPLFAAWINDRPACNSVIDHQ